MPEHLKAKTLHGLFWSFLERIGQQGIQFAISIILARLLMPAQFGLIAMLNLFMALAQTFLDSGFGSALIQKQDVTRVDESSIFYFNIGVGAVAAGLLCLAAPWIAAFYKTPILTPLTRVLSLNLVINSFGLVQTTLMAKRVDFKTQMKITISSSVLSGVVGIVMAYRGFGVWSLVAQSLGSSVLRTALLWVFNAWRPLWAFSCGSLRSMFSFGSKLLASGLMYTVTDNMYSLVIGKVFSPAALGFYARAASVQRLPLTNLAESVQRVTFPVFSSVQDDKERLKRGLRKVLTTMSLVSLPMMIGLAIIARPLVSVLFTDKWLPCVPYLQLLCLVGTLDPLRRENTNILLAQGRSDLYLKLDVLKKVLELVAIFVTFRWGIMALICGQLVVAVVAYYLNSYYTGRMLGYPILEQVGDLLPTLWLALAMGAGVWAVGLIPLGSQVARLAIQVAAGILAYAALCHVFRLASFKELVDVIRPRLLGSPAETG
ncbi:MOP flippase family protein [candidate division WOR-3 bacterium]|nr:MOP flippase family protein [candidate division WOR-3 bacterium]